MFEPAESSRKNFDVIILTAFFHSYLWTFTALKCTKWHHLTHIYIYHSLFTVAGIVKNSRRSSIAPRRLNRLCFIHDNYEKFFPRSRPSVVCDSVAYSYLVYEAGTSFTSFANVLPSSLTKIVTFVTAGRWDS